MKKMIENAYRITLRLMVILAACWLLPHQAGGQGLQNLYFNSFDNIIRLNFATNPPVPYSTYIPGSYEGIAHYEDSNGNVLFAFNSNGVYTANNNFMNGSFGILANSSSTEICVAPVPGNPNQYYIIYNAEVCSALYFSKVDMSLNGGQGNVIALNTMISNLNHSEGLEVIDIPGSDNFWLLTYQCNVGFTRYLISETGIGDGTVIHPYPMPPGGYDGRGALDYYKGRLGACFAWSDQVFAAGFDPVSGTICNPVTLNSPAFSNNPYGVEFSPDASKMYFTLWYTTGQPNVFQYNFATGVYTGFQPAFGSTGFISGFGEIEMGRDGKLYIIQDGGSNITVLNNPNEDTPDFSLIPTIATTLGLGITNQIHWESPGVTIVSNTLCANMGETIVLQPYSANGVYEWAKTDNPSMLIAIDSMLIVTVTEAEQGYLARGAFSSECYTSSTGQFEWTIYTNPVVETSPLQITVCNGSDVTLSASGGQSYLWSNGATTPTTIVSPAETTAYIVTVTHSNGCSSTGQSVVSVLEGEPFTISGTASDEPTLTCLSESTYTVGFVMEGGNLPYWVNGTAITGNTYLSNVLNSTEFSFTVTDAQGCSEQVSGYNYQCNPDCWVDANLQTIFYQDNCSDGFEVIVSSSATPISELQYAINGGEFQNSPVFTGLTQGYYSVSVLTDCGVQILPQTFIQEQSVLTVQLQVEYAAIWEYVGMVTISGGTPPYSVLWHTGATETTTNLGNMFLPGWVTITDSAGCQKDIPFTRDGAVSISETSKPESMFTLYPNPAHNIVNITAQLPIIGTATITLYNLHGQQLLQRTTLFDQPETIELTQFSAGIYFVVIESGNGRQTYKILRSY